MQKLFGELVCDVTECALWVHEGCTLYFTMSCLPLKPVSVSLMCSSQESLGIHQTLISVFSHKCFSIVFWCWTPSEPMGSHCICTSSGVLLLLRLIEVGVRSTSWSLHSSEGEKKHQYLSVHTWTHTAHRHERRNTSVYLCTPEHIQHTGMRGVTVERNSALHCDILCLCLVKNICVYRANTLQAQSTDYFRGQPL